MATLLPLRLARFGASGLAIGATFFLASLLSARVATVTGRLVDRRGARGPLSAGLGISAVLVAMFALPRSPVLLSALIVIAVGGPLTLYMVPSMTVITEFVDRQGLALAFGTMLLSLAWSMGETFGAPAATGLAHATSDAVPFAVLGATMIVTLIAVRRSRLTEPNPSSPEGEADWAPERPPHGDAASLGVASA
jgi:MFS family permease